MRNIISFGVVAAIVFWISGGKSLFKKRGPDTVQLEFNQTIYKHAIRTCQLFEVPIIRTELYEQPELASSARMWLELKGYRRSNLGLGSGFWVQSRMVVAH
jgi:hypothetical protein